MTDDFSGRVERYRNLIDAVLLDIGKNDENLNCSQNFNVTI